MTTLNWIYSSTPPLNTTNWLSVCSGDNTFVAVGRNQGAAAYSTDGGIIWTPSTGVEVSIIWQSVCYGNGLFVAVSGNSTSNTTAVMYSTDGQNWKSTGITIGITGYVYADWTSICYGDSTFVAVSSNGGYDVMTSTNMSSSGGSWATDLISTNIDLRSVCYGELSSSPTFVAVGVSKAVYSTNSGSSWLSCGGSAISAGTWLSVCYGNGIFMAVGINIFMISTNGINWTTTTTTTIPSGNWYSVCYADNGTEQVFVVTDDSNSVTTNDLGLNWTQSSTPSGTVSWESVAYNPSLNYLAAVSYNNIQNQGMYALLCFKEGSKILTDKGYVEIQNLRKGDSVQTLKDGFKKIVFLGKKKMVQNGIEERIKDQLYKYSSKEYPKLFEDLVLTGGHSILVDNLTDEERENMRIRMFDLFKGEDFIIDDKKCLLSYLNNKAEIYEKKGSHMIYHFALEGDYYKNYGVYANGLLVEACSQHIFLEYVHPDTRYCQRTLFYLLFILTYFNDITEFIKSKSMGLLKMRRKLKNEKLVNENDSFSEFHSVF